MTRQVTQAIEPATLNARRLLSLLGVRASHHDVAALLEQLELRPDLSKRWSVAAAAPAHGLDLRFCRGHELAEELGLSAEQEQLLACIFFHAAGHEGHCGFAGALPFGLELGMSRSRAREVLGAPFWSGLRHPSDRWNFDRCYLCLDFAEDAASIQLVTVGLPWRARA